MNTSYLLFLETDGVEEIFRATMSLMSIRGQECVKLTWEGKSDMIDRLNNEDRLFHKKVYGINEFSFRTTAINDTNILDEITLLKEYDEVNKCLFEYETPAPVIIDKYAGNPTKEICHCGERIAFTFFHQWWCSECYSRMNWD